VVAVPVEHLLRLEELQVHHQFFQRLHQQVAVAEVLVEQE
jgi:hypothetical protein